jgi:hypothetical protein
MQYPDAVFYNLGYGLDNRGPILVRGWYFFFSPPRSDWLWDPPSLLSNDYRDSFPGGKEVGCEANRSPLCSAEVNNVWSYTSTSQYVFMAWCLVKHRDNCNFDFTFLRWQLGYI